ncbi:molybdopterin converting factor, subunit 1 [SAR116 cluster alpha proteobacterium HIMB100]|nr:molybdopterin converting factor, subunit 1 [SAR116 cluster alpha proteobacterium HIMB100]
MKILYFAWMREHTGCASEQIDLPEDVHTVAELVTYLADQSAGHATALRNLKTVRIAVNRKYAALDTPISSADEVAFFPPVTGG